MAKRPDQRRFRDLLVQSLGRQNNKLEQFEGILREHDAGYFSRSSLLCDEVMTDARIMGVMRTRIGGLASAQFEMKPAGETALQRKLAEELGGNDRQGGKWDQLVALPVVGQLQFWGLLLGFAVGEIVWEGDSNRWMPRVVPWHPMHVHFDMWNRRFWLNTMDGVVILPRPDEQPRGDGKWFVWCPYGVQYGWRNGLLRSLAFMYLSRSWVERDWDRYNEMRAMGMIKALTPAGAKPQETDPFFEELQNMGSESVVMCPQGSGDQKGYDIQPVEFMSRNWETMKERRSALDTDIAVLVLGQNLTTEVTGGSRAASTTHDLIRIDKALEDATIGTAFRQQVLMPWMVANSGDPDDAPRPTYQVAPPEDDKGNAEALLAIGQAGQALLLADPQVDIATLFQEEGIPRLTDEEFAAQEAEEAAEEAARPKVVEPGAPADPAAPADGDQSPEAKATKGRAALSGVVKRCQFMGLPIAIENPVGSIRLWTDGEGKSGSTKMALDYGHIEGHLSADGEELDCYLGPDENAGSVYVVHQLKAPDFRGHDEDKVMLGFSSADDAKIGYLVHRDDGERAFGGMSVIPVSRFKSKLRQRGPEATGKIRAHALDVERSLMALAGRARQATTLARTVAGKKRSAKYQEALIENGTRRAAHALAPFISGLKAEVDRAGSFQELRRSIVRYLRNESPDKLAKVVRMTNILARLSGHASATEEV